MGLDHEDLPPRRVTMNLSAPTASTTRLSIAHEAADDDERRSYEEGWEHFLGKLQRVLAGED